MKAVMVMTKNNVVSGKDSKVFSINEHNLRKNSRIRGGVVVMGGNTFFNQRGCVPYDHASLNIVLTREPLRFGKICLEYRNLMIMDVPSYLTGFHDESHWVVGGGTTFDLLKDTIDEIYLTKVHKIVRGDVQKLTLDWKAYKLVELTDIKEHLGIPYQFLVYRRKPTPVVNTEQLA